MFDVQKVTPQGLRRMVRDLRRALQSVLELEVTQHDAQEVLAGQLGAPHWHALITAAKRRDTPMAPPPSASTPEEPSVRWCPPGWVTWTDWQPSQWAHDLLSRWSVPLREDDDWSAPLRQGIDSVRQALAAESVWMAQRAFDEVGQGLVWVSDQVLAKGLVSVGWPHQEQLSNTQVHHQRMDDAWQRALTAWAEWAVEDDDTTASFEAFLALDPLIPPASLPQEGVKKYWTWTSAQDRLDQWVSHALRHHHGPVLTLLNERFPGCLEGPEHLRRLLREGPVLQSTVEALLALQTAPERYTQALAEVLIDAESGLDRYHALAHRLLTLGADMAELGPAILAQTKARDRRALRPMALLNAEALEGLWLRQQSAQAHINQVKEGMAQGARQGRGRFHLTK